MKACKRLAALLLAITLVITSTVVGLVLPVAAEGDTFKLATDELYLAPKDSGGYIVYGAVPALNPDGTPYEGTLTWSSSKTSVASINASTGRIATAAAGTTVVTATNAAGESHSCTVYVRWDGERVGGGDMESSVLLATNRWTSGFLKGDVEVVDEPYSDGNRVMKFPSGSSKGNYYYYLCMEKNTRYMLSFDVRGELNNGDDEIVVGYLSNSDKTGNIYAKPVGDRWKHYYWTFTTSSSANRNYIFNICNQNLSGGSNTNPIYIDNISLVQLGTAESITMNTEEYHLEIGGDVTLSATPTPSDATMNRVIWSSDAENVATVDANGKITAIAPGVATITAKAGLLKATCTITVHKELINAAPSPDVQNGTIETDAVIGELKVGDIVTVTATPDEGYLMVPGSLCYVKKDGTKVKILNQSMTDSTFGGGIGYTFEFIMPEGAVSVTAEFESTTEQDFQMQTIGTSVHQAGVDAEGEPIYDGVRFLTRMNLVTKFDENTSTLSVLYNGKEYTVEELGSLLKREENDTELTYDNAVANTGTAGIGKMWVSKAFESKTGTFRLVDYTESYIDFVSVMMTKYLDRFYTARGYARLKDVEGNIETILLDELANSISTVVRILPPVQTLEGVTAEKWSPYAESITVEPGQKLTYTIKVTNGDNAGTVTVFDPIPENTTYVEGADELIGKTAVWTLELAAGEVKELTYTVQIDDDKELCEGGTIEATTVQVGDKEIACDNTLYIERSVSKYDEYFVNNVIKALGDSSFAELGLVYRVEYQSYTNAHTAFRRDSGYNGLTGAAVLDAVIHGDGVATYTYTNSSNKSSTGTLNLLDMVAPTLYGGTEVTGQIAGVKGAPAAAVTEDNLMIGDVVVVKNNGTVSMYIYCDRGLLLLKPTGGTEKANMAILDILTTGDAYLVLRWRACLTSTTSTDAETQPVELTPEQEAVIKTGEAFLMRGEKVQYADTSLASNADYRWAIEQVSPEDASAINWKYTNCAAFCYDSYYFGLNYKLGGGNLYTTANMAANTTMRMFNLPRAVTDTYTDEEKATLSAQFVNTLQPGDLMVIRRSSGSGHVMMYIGNGKMIHSTGSNYNYTYSREYYEPSIAYGQVQDYFLDPAGANYLFGHPEDTATNQSIQICIIRPLSKFTGEIPENTTNRINNLTGVVAQKVASHTLANTVTAGDTITYTYKIRNTNDKAVTLEIKDTVPANTTYVSGGEIVNGDELSWTVTVPADESVEVSFTVRVNEGLAKDTLIQSTAGTVGGVKFTTRDITVANTLTAEQQEAIKTATQELIAEGTTLRDFEFVNAVYERALGVENIFESTDSLVIATDETDGVFDTTGTTATPYWLATEGKYREMVAPTMYGGRKVDSNLWDKNRIRLPKPEHMVVGDVLIYRTSSATNIYFYNGEKFIKLTSTIADDTASAKSRLAYTLAVGNYFVVLRPSMTMETSAE